jgi:hypothetical protein
MIGTKPKSIALPHNKQSQRTVSSIDICNPEEE